MSIKLEAGMVKVCLEPTRETTDAFLPDDECIDRLLEITYVEEVGAYGAADYVVICSFSSIDRMKDELPRTIMRVNEVLSGAGKQW